MATPLEKVMWLNARVDDCDCTHARPAYQLIEVIEEHRNKPWLRKRKVISNDATGIETLPDFQRGMNKKEWKKTIEFERFSSCWILETCTIQVMRQSPLTTYDSFRKRQFHFFGMSSFIFVSCRFPCFSAVEVLLQQNKEFVAAALLCTMILTLWR